MPALIIVGFVDKFSSIWTMISDLWSQKIFSLNAQPEIQIYNRLY